MCMSPLESNVFQSNTLMELLRKNVATEKSADVTVSADHLVLRSAVVFYYSISLIADGLNLKNVMFL